MTRHKNKAPLITGLDGDGVPDEENPEWTAEMFKSAKKFHELPASLQKKLAAIQKRGRPPKELKAKPATIRLSPKVDAYFRATGKGWQTRINAALEQWLEQHS